MRHLALLLLAMIGLALATTPAHAARSYDTCTSTIASLPAVINSPGTYCLNQDMTTAMTSGEAIDITSTDVVIDCDDFRLDDLAAGAATTAIGVYTSNNERVTVRNCNVRGFQKGIDLEDNGSGGGSNLVEDNHLDGNTGVGITSLGTRSIVRRNIVLDTGGSSKSPTTATGIHVDGDSDVSYNLVSGVVTKAGSGEIAYGIVHDGQWFYGSVNWNHVNNIATSATGVSYGIYLGGQRMIARDNILSGVAIGTSHAIGCPSAAANNRVLYTVAGGFTDTSLGTCGDAGGNDFHP